MQTKKILGIALAAALVGSMATVAAVSVSAADFDVSTKTLGIIGDINGAWDTDTAMTDPDGDGIYTGVVKDVAAGSYQFKVRADGDWTDSWGVYEADYDRTYNSQTNCSITLNDPANVVVSLDTTGDDFNVWPVSFYAYVPQTKYTFGIIGDINGAWDTDTAMTDEDGDGIYTGVVENVAPGSYQFKVRSDGAWTDSWGVYEADYDRTYNSQTNCSVTLDATTDVTVSIDTTGDDEIVWPITFSYVDADGVKQTVYTGKVDEPIEEPSEEESSEEESSEESVEESSEESVEIPAYVTVKDDYIYFDNSKTQWEKVCIYFWNSELGATVDRFGRGYGAEFPGVEMTKIEGTDIYQALVPFQATKIIFNSGVTDKVMATGVDAYQTVDLDFDSAVNAGQIYTIDTSVPAEPGRGVEKTKYKYSEGAWTNYEGEFMSESFGTEDITPESSEESTSTAPTESSTTPSGDNSSTNVPPTGDSTMTIVFVVVGFAALATIVLATKKKSVKD